MVPPGTFHFATTVCPKSILEPPGSLWELINILREPPGAHSEPFGASRTSFGALWILQHLILDIIFQLWELLGGNFQAREVIFDLWGLPGAYFPPPGSLCARQHGATKQLSL